MSTTDHSSMPQHGTELPLFVDLDGTLIRGDIAQELLLKALKDRNNYGAITRTMLSSTSETKRLLSEFDTFSPASLAYNDVVLDYIRAAKEAGRSVYLATASDSLVAQQVADHLGLFDGVLATTPGNNLKGEVKLSAIRDAAGGGPFEYIGDSKADEPIWQAAERSGFVNAPKAAVNAAELSNSVSLVINDKPDRVRALIKAMRPHQWTKSLLIFVPLLFSHSYTSPDAVATTVFAFVLFSICASSIYIINDLLDIEADRVHPKKRFRPFASSDLMPVDGIVAAVVLVSASLTISFLTMPLMFSFVLLVYLAATTAYSFVLKHYSTIDVVTLTGLYTLRLVAGAAAIQVELSPWLLNFSIFFFLSLAYLKRYIELDRSDETQLEGRNYASDEIDIIAATGLVNGGLSVLTLSLYLNSDFVNATYASPSLLWLICPLFLFWIYRCWLWAKRGKIDDDPVVFAIKDRISLLTALLTAAIIVVAKYVNLNEMIK